MAVMAGDWIEIAMKGMVALGGAIFGALAGIWHWGRNSALAEQSVTNQIAALREEVRKDMASHTQKAADGNDLLVAQFKESFEGIRRQHDDLKLDVERRFLPKDEFRDWLKDFREEYRQHQQRTDDKLDKLLGMRQQ